VNALVTLLYFPILPRATIRLHEGSSLAGIYLIHVLGLLLLGAEATAMNYWHCAQHYGAEPLLPKIASDYDVALNTALVLICGEVAFVLVGTIMMCWAGCDESTLDTWKHAIKVSWLYVGHLLLVLPGTVGVIMLAEELDLSEQHWAPIILPVIAAVIIWSIVSYLRAMTARHAPESPTYPFCRSCGYNISHLDPEGRCPECGRDIADSMPERAPDLDEINDPICEWCGYSLHHLDPAGSCPECGHRVALSLHETPRRPPEELTRLVDLCAAPWSNPELLFRSITVHNRSRSAVKCFVLGVAGAGFAGWGAAILGSGAVGMLPGLNEAIVLLAPMIGLFGFLYFMTASALATLFGFLTSNHVGRNRFTAALNTVMLLSPVLPLWSFGGVITFILIVLEFPSNHTIYGWVALNLLVLFIFAGAIHRRMPFVQYANR
jgi:hypothetical protein